MARKPRKRGHLTLETDRGVNRSKASELARALMEIKRKMHSDLEDSGDDIDLDSYINLVSGGSDPNIYSSEYYDPGFSAVIVVDASGSMGGPKFDTVSKTAAILAAAFEKIGGIDFCVITFRSHRDMHGLPSLGVAHYEKPHDISSMPMKSGNTPIHLGIAYGANYLAKLKSTTKLLIILTDGQMNSDDIYEAARKRKLPPGDYSNLECQMRVEDVRRRGMHVYGFGVETQATIGDDNFLKLEADMRAIFGDGYFYTVVDMNEADKWMRKLITQGIVAHLKGTG